MEKRNDSSGDERYQIPSSGFFSTWEADLVVLTSRSWISSVDQRLVEDKKKTATTMVILGIIFQRFGYNKIQQKLTSWYLTSWLQKPDIPDFKSHLSAFVQENTLEKFK